MTARQVETATVIGSVTGTGTVIATITARGMTNSPKAISVSVTNGDSASAVGAAIRSALAFDQDVAALFLVSGSGADIVLTRHTAAANDSSLNIAIANGTATGLTAAPTSANTTAGDGIDNGYAELAELKGKYLLELDSISTYDDLLSKVITGVSRKIDNHCGCHFYRVTETRYFTPENPYRLSIDEIATSSGFLLYTDQDGDGDYEYTWASSDYFLLPSNAQTKGRPYTSIERRPLGDYSFPLVREGVKITASFGWADIPEPVSLACLLQSNRIVKRFLTPLGESGATPVGTIKLSIPALDPDVLNLLRDYVRLED